MESLPHVAIYLTNTARTPKATILQQVLVRSSQLSKRRRWNHADRLLFLLQSENQELVEKIFLFFLLFVTPWIGPFVMFGGCT